MRRRLAWVVLPFVLLASGCVQNTWHSQDLRVDFAFRPELPQLPLINPRGDLSPRFYPFFRDIVQGEPVPVTFTIINTGDQPIILLRLDITRMPGTYHAWSHPIYGRLVKRDSGDSYDFYPDVNAKADRNFISGFLFPGERKTVDLMLQFWESGKVRQNFSLTCYRKDPDILKSEIYTPREDPLAKCIHYEHPATGDVDDWEKAPNRFRSLLLDGQGGDRIFSFGRDFNVKAVEFGYEAAIAKAGFEPDTFGYSAWREGWALQKDDNLTVVTPGSVVRYEGVTLDVFKFIESCRGLYIPKVLPGPDVVKVRVLPGVVPFHIWNEDAYKVVADVFRDYASTLRRGHRIEVPVDDVFKVIKELHRRGYITEVTTFESEPVLEIERLKK